VNAPALAVPPAVLAAIGDLELLARTALAGIAPGLHRAREAGTSSEFVEYRNYEPGDDIRHLDWNLYARSDRLAIRRFAGETAARVHLLLDASGSMAFRGPRSPASKFDYARWLAAALAWLAFRQHDAVSLTVFADGVRVHLPPSSRAAARSALFAALATAAPAAGTDLAVPLRLLSGVPASLCVLLSDCYADAAVLVRACAALAARGSDVLVVQVLDAAEVSPDARTRRLRDMEDGRSVVADGGDLGAGYRQRLAAHREALAQGVAGIGGGFLGIATDAPLDAALAGYLRSRRRLRRVGR
jgi:uncharacterized protein (DUF58 family)